MKKQKKLVTAVINRLDILTVLVLTMILTLFFLSRNPKFLSINNLFNLIQQNASLIIVSVGMTFVIISGNMDLSSGSLIVLTACITGVIYRDVGSIWLGLAACLISATLIGVINGFLIAYGRINAVIITLSCMVWARGLALGITDTKSIAVPSPVLQAIYKPFAFSFVNISFCIVLASLVLGWFLLTRTKFGRYAKALGENEKATELAGVNTRRIKWLIFVFASFLSGVASVIDLSRLGSAVTTIGNQMEMNAIVAVVIGGTKLRGGEGSFGKTICGLLFMCVLSNGLSTLGIMDNYLYLLKGVIILCALAIQMFSNRYRLYSLRRLNETE